jgi:hypothetical protein
MIQQRDMETPPLIRVGVKVVGGDIVVDPHKEEAIYLL